MKSILLLKIRNINQFMEVLIMSFDCSLCVYKNTCMAAFRAKECNRFEIVQDFKYDYDRWKEKQERKKNKYGWLF